ncbi:MAG: 4-hydroxythreonine-4-phosphate dehydrogenase PdxA [Candidatus Omnitrophica bacterium]|nr:4-hydroxythreonine-4-phosphate dehydrogenase PdxA [Candidatus Omnitrophota bacterium]MDD5771008.1 4-hydroxythreonine-4-phosphate dehydrogenase PdxA [Candidatus Omnitrophota bacterium]
MGLKNNPTLKSSKIRVGITIGDPAGIGPAITIKALKSLRGKADFTVIGDKYVLSRAAGLLHTNTPPFRLLDLNNIKNRNFVFGKISPFNGRASLEYLEAAAELLKHKQLDCLVTCPVSKEAISMSGPRFFGHTEYLAAKFKRKQPVMMLINKRFRFSLVTRHIPLRDVSEKISRRKVKDNILVTVKGLKDLFLIARPRIVVCGINPHASDNGLIGMDELRMIKPAVNSLKGRCLGASVSGPVSADIAIADSARGEFDCVIALYHDQALIPLKLTGFNSGVNLTLGLPFVRTSPLHGTAFDLAKKPVLANSGSLLAAIKLAITCTSNQRKA